MFKDPLLQKGHKLWAKGRFNELSNLLEPQIFKYRDMPEFYKLLGLACIYQDDWKGAETYLKRFTQLDETQDKDVFLGLAAIYAHFGEWTQAIQTWLSVLEAYPKCKQAKKGLNSLKQAMAQKKPELLVQSKYFRTCFPLPPSQLARLLLKILIVIIIGASLSGGILLGSKLIPKPQSIVSVPAVSREGTPADVNSTTTPLQTGGIWKITLTQDEAFKAYRDARTYFQNYKDSLARQEINRLLLSNASQNLKEKAQTLIQYLKDPDFTTFQDSASYDQVKQFPELYEGCAVKWKGVISNLFSGKTLIHFDFLIGYQDGQVVQGIVPVDLNFAALLRNSQIVEILGVVVLDKDHWKLRGVVLRNEGFRS